MTTLLEINNRAQQIKHELEVAIENYDRTYSFFRNRLCEAKQKVVFANLKYVMRRDLTYDISNVDEELEKIITEARSLPSYNLANVFVSVKRYMRIRKESNAVHAHYICKLKLWNKEITEYMDWLCDQPSSKTNARILDLVGNLQADLYNEEYGSGSPGGFKALEDMSMLDLMVMKDFKMAKTEFLQLVTIDRSPPIPIKIAALPEVIDYEVLVDAVFINRIEDDDDCYLFDLFYERFKKELAENKTFRENVNGVYKDMSDMIATYSTVIDDIGDIPMELNKPNLRIVHNNDLN